MCVTPRALFFISLLLSASQKWPHVSQYHISSGGSKVTKITIFVNFSCSSDHKTEVINLTPCSPPPTHTHSGHDTCLCTVATVFYVTTHHTAAYACLYVGVEMCSLNKCSGVDVQARLRRKDSRLDRTVPARKVVMMFNPGTLCIQAACLMLGMDCTWGGYMGAGTWRVDTWGQVHVGQIHGG